MHMKQLIHYYTTHSYRMNQIPQRDNRFILDFAKKVHSQH